MAVLTRRTWQDLFDRAQRARAHSVEVTEKAAALLDIPRRRPEPNADQQPQTVIQMR